jgi:hypothetical protein
MKARTRILAGLLAWLAGCASPPPEQPPADARLLDGTWVVDFTLESPLLPGRMPRQQTLRGQVALLRNASLTGAGLSGRPTHSGTYAASFRPFGFEIDGRQLPALEARASASHSVEIRLQPGGPAGVWMRGLLTGDSVAGTWRYDHDRGGIASGRFVMRRR